MKTKTIVIGQSVEKEQLTKIKFTKYLDYNAEICSDPGTLYDPNNYNFIELICKDYEVGVDLMFAYNNPNDRSNGVLHLGKWGDGVV